MDLKTRFENIRDMLRQVDWKLLLFLLLVLNLKLWVKIVALILIYCMQFNFRFGFKWKSSRLPLFYVIIMVIALFNWIAYGLYAHAHYTFVMLTGLFFWIFCILAIHQLKLSAEHSSVAVLSNTLQLFFILNFLVSFANLLAIIMETGALNPYQYQGLYQKYFIGTGDYIKGIAFDTSTTNALINAFGVVFFLSRKKMALTVCCMITLLLTCSNLTNLLLVVALVFSFIFQSDRDQKSIIIICLFLLVVFLGRVSPQNNQYSFSAAKTLLHIPDNKTAAVADPGNKPNSSLSLEEKQIQKAESYLDSLRLSWATVTAKKASLLNPWIKPFIPQPNLNAKEFQSAMDTTGLQRTLIVFSNSHYTDTARFLKMMRITKAPGKRIAMQETIRFLMKNPNRIISGNGMGNFSSKLAFRVAALHIAGKYPEKLAYIHPDFLNNHLRLYLYYFTQHKDVHSIIHTPDSVFNQLTGEYGIAGLVSFLVFYLGWFAISLKKTACSVPVLMIMAGAFLTGYWFEQLSVVIFFELLMLIDHKLHPINIIAKEIK